MAVAALGGLGAAQDPATSRLGERLKGSTFTVEWGEPAEWSPDVEVEAEFAHVSHRAPPGCTDWYRLRAAGDWVEVLRIVSRGVGRGPDRASVWLARARLGMDAYRVLLADLARIEAARLVPIPVRRYLSGFDTEFGVAIRVADARGVRFGERWAGKPGSIEEIRYAKPEAAVKLVEDGIAPLQFEPCEPTGELREWVGR
jgi:hypothetical protein